jgi:TonB family protein
MLIALLFLTVSPQAQPRLPIHVESLPYPEIARQARIQGDAVLVAHIGADGSVSIPLRKSGHPLLLQAAEDNLKSWKFQSGEEQEMEITYHFKLVATESPADSAPADCVFDLPNSVTISSAPPKTFTTY